ncbi:hypothetical protein D7X33_15360 [Butyricicoccus sp. 1XD8-22]|nr:hypothetical protein D7X33_15360 [Butyricicoccus sp. 1XD8-22]
MSIGIHGELKTTTRNGNSGGKRCGHELLALSVEDYDNYSVIGVYDSNFPNVVRPLYLYRTNGEFTSWEYRLFYDVTWGTSRPGAEITHTSSSLDAYDSIKNSQLASLTGAQIILTSSPIITLRNDGEIINLSGDETGTDKVVPTYSNGVLADNADDSANDEYYAYWIISDNELEFLGFEQNQEIVVASGDNAVSVNASQKSTITIDTAGVHAKKSVQIAPIDNASNTATIIYFGNDGNDNLKELTLDVTADSDISSHYTDNEIHLDGVTSLTIETETDTVALPNLDETYRYQIKIDDETDKVVFVKADTTDDGDYDDVVYPAQNDHAPYTITFDANGGNISPMTAVTGSDGKLSDIPVPARSGYTFEGWYTELSGGTRITENTTFTQDTIVYAHWTYKGNDSNLSGSGESSSHSRRHKASVSTDHSIIISDTIGGMVRSNRSSVAEGDKVTLTILVDDGYELDNLSVETVSGSTIRTTQISGERYTFIMPDEEVTVYAVFKPTNEIGQLPEIPFNFTDVPQNEYYYDAVRWAVEQGITSGTTLTMFSPDKSCTRAEAVTFLWRANGCPSPLGNVNPFTDVARDEYYYNAVLWAVENGIASGTSATTFSPNAVVTRGQTVSFLYRAAGSPAVGGGLPFLDVASDAYYANAVQWAVSEGITSGTSAMAFSPDADCTRAQIVVFLYRAQS